MQNIKSLSIDKKRKEIITEDIIYKKAIINNKDNNDNHLKNDIINQTVNDNDNDNDENLINTDSTLDTAKVKYIYKKKLNFSNNKIHFSKSKYYCFKKFYTIKSGIKIHHNESNKTPSTQFLGKIKKINSNLILDNNNIKMLKTSNNFYKKKIILETDNSMMAKTSNNFYKEKKNKEESEFINNNINNDNIFLKDLIIYEEKLNNLINSINNKVDINISKECLESINYFFNSSLYNNLEMYAINNNQSQLIIHKTINYIIYNAILAYHISFDKSFLNTCLDYLAIIINISNKCYLLICENIVNKLINNWNDNMQKEKILSMLKNNLFHIEINDKDFVKYLTSRKYIISKDKINYIHELKYYLFLVQKYIKVLLKNLTNDGNKKDDLLQIFNNIKNISLKEMNDFFQKNIKVKKIPQEIDNLYPPTNPEIKPPYIKTQLTKKFSLVLDLDETLISLDRNKTNNNNKGILKLRPGLIRFLSKIKNFYEIIVFTSGTKEYGDQIIDVIENDEKYFDHRLYRDHTLFYNNEYIKDISRIGRPLDKIIIVDNLPQNFRLQKENGIEIKPFFGDDNNDKALSSLGNILKRIANNFNDTRNGILEYRNEIKKKIS